ncbi:GNAT family N-acetyltransferase [Pseudoxanthomonas sp.]|uniref:GNAT family N-acetyltransferase n=1 Tax=Pseudoxanthomonas sp. TaxID=1871049 RepID=UPI0026347035|nr:GNAT family N-acetyltransferase [Pseudoxanthomonas sp.]WDS37112.1 MAG: GNAT family N-acetyltransferase [Pseudoxanthomonas sp.]
MSTTTTDFTLRPASFTNDREALRAVRETVFVAEQHAPPDTEWDSMDPVGDHMLAINATGAPIGTARLTPDGRFSRLAVLKSWRGKGVGEALLLAMIDKARAQGWTQLTLYAQVATEGFYKRHGFVVEGAPFDDVGILHQSMRLKLRD